MLQPIMSELSAMRIVLASGSPRRRHMLSSIGLKFEVVPSTFEENLDKSSFSSAVEYAKETARMKATEVAQRLKEANEPDLVIAADTVVTLGERIFEKPKDKKNAFEMLSQLSGTTHQVHTGMALITRKKGNSCQPDSPFIITQFHETTEVTFGDLSPEVIQGYVDTGEPLDKAGGYGIQELGGTLVKGVNGDYFNVVGFPLYNFCRHLAQLV
ncbi:N-acetylserotonin O-methyltransferase-like protein [Acanthaster planci]|uniref:N-acetylserotonin O-methyltransferase-like protein n=1 Tax=Acanthaster planci TaxID=133434 RepID=A0A8B7YE64_ACAPL|nr:N-acetylserotonin O-methyltransferase-like protein [Acanthaster planci]XP_022091543.1 N-acetylserotonin O-methyltransferase-like protein [Acanthaster planci]